MQRNKNLQIKILKHLTNSLGPHGGFALESIQNNEGDEFSGYKDDEIMHAIQMLYEESLIDAQDCSSKDGKNFLIRNITPEGYNYLDEVKNNTLSKIAVKKTFILFAWLSSIVITAIITALIAKYLSTP